MEFLIIILILAAVSALVYFLYDRREVTESGTRKSGGSDNSDPNADPRENTN